MNKEQELIIKEFDGQEVAFKEINGISNVRINEIAKFCGWSYIKADRNNKEFIRWNTVNKFLGELGVAECCDGDFIPEYVMYALIGKAKNERATKFMLWVGQVLVEIRKHGAYISDNEENVDQGYIKYTYGQLKNTFTSCPIEFLLETYEDCMEWHKQNKTRIPYANNSKKRSDATHPRTESKIMIMQKIISTLESRNLLLCEGGKFGIVSEVDSVIKQIKDNVKKQYNKSNGAKIANKTKKINQLQKEIDYHNPKFENFIECKTAPISNNAMYEAVSDWNTGEPTMVKSQKYKNWLYYFDDSKLNIFADLDFSKPVYIHAKYIMSKNQDMSNFIKPLHDKIATYFEVDDRLFISGKQECLEYYDDVRDGRIFLYLCN